MASHNPWPSALASTLARSARVWSLLSKAISISTVAPVVTLSLGSRKKMSVAPSTTCR